MITRGQIIAVLNEHLPTRVRYGYHAQNEAEIEYGDVLDDIAGEILRLTDAVPPIKRDSHGNRDAEEEREKR